MSASVMIEPQLNAEFLKSHPEQKMFPERVLQFGEGGFLRGFVDWMIHGMNQQGLFKGRVVVVQPIAHGQADMLNRQNGAYTLLMRGIESDKVVERQEIIRSISRAINPYTDFEEFLACARNPDLRFIVSNTTEAGIAYCGDDKLTDAPPASFPAKVTRFLLERYEAFGGDESRGFIFLPCELIDLNGTNLKKTVLQTATNWNLDAVFIDWIEKANIFTNTLVDRIVTGYPKDEITSLEAIAGYRDDLFDTSELFHLWVIEGPASLCDELPLAKAGFNVVVANSIKPYRDRKVGILNGAHTSTVLAAYLSGFDYVGDFMADPTISNFMKQAIFQEVVPTLTLPQEELQLFAAAVFDRFSNPFIRHALLSISLNSVSKFKARVLPTMERYIAINARLPRRLTFALAALIVFYRGTEIEEGVLVGHRGEEHYAIKDNLSILESMAALWSNFDGTPGRVGKLTNEILQRADWWGKDLTTIPGLSQAVSIYTSSILEVGASEAMAKI